MSSTENTEFEVRFLEINKSEIIKKALLLGFTDLGENILDEIIFYDKDLKWRNEGKYARLRGYAGKIILTYKHISKDAVDGAEELEIEVSDLKKAKKILLKFGLVDFRIQQKKRHTLKKGKITLDIDTWPSIATYLEIEGEDENSIKDMVGQLGLDYTQASFLDARKIIESYGVDVSTFKYFTFDKIG